MPVAKDNQFWDALMENKVAKKLIKKHKCKGKCENIDELAQRYEVSKQEVEKVFKIFQLMDDDGSGTISSSEVAKMLNELGIDVSPKVVQAVMRSSDVSGDGQIDFEEFLAAVTSKIKLSTVKADVQLMLSKIDHNPEKVISAEELVVAWSETVSTNITVKEACALIQQADTQGRGKATIHEFITMCQTV
ncbi:hypothetical protein GCK72_009769 [Caenorhabditis remanei]|uniref:EF-hand domain-containing protein n=2 Tax=Caenorhabditis remanei TaxID=31234 RepID=E3LT31_CAERE|nr:hypothetical protein GCK72_009769 [Caenorhabditis remanei]EFP09635.1 hypothetical protein CRE_25423 [Caenorhabditis remanei]KAF1761513.1 hypothetical protein GCK72_009769 [Caenorhabditis remanei]